MTDTASSSTPGKFNTWRIALGVFLLGLLLFLSVRASDKYRWSDWGFGDAQTMLSLRQWDRGGWFSNYFLFIPQGYAKVVQLFDDPELRHHAHGTCPGSAPGVGPRLWYTHYPAGYLIPYAVLFRIGLDSLFAVRMLSIFFSIMALILMYIVFSRITSEAVAFFAVLFYGLTPTFLGYSDTLANQPLDDLLRFGFMLAIILATRSASELHRKRWMISAWIMEFALSMSSFDSVFFLFVWIIGWDFLDGRGFRWKRYLIYALAPLSAHSIQFLQNVWYLGFETAVEDIKVAFLLKNAANAEYNMGADRLTVIKDTIPILFDNLYKPAVLLLAVIGMYACYALLIRKSGDEKLPSAKLLAVLFLCGLSFILVLPHAARMPYEARQMIPFTALLVSGFTCSFPHLFIQSIHGNAGQGAEAVSLFRKITVPLYLFLSLFLIMAFWYRFAMNSREPVYYIPDAATYADYASKIEYQKRFDLARYNQLRNEVLLAEELQKLPTKYEPVFFSLYGFQLFWDPKYVPGYPQIMPITEYYTGSKPLLCFNSGEGVVKDLMYMLQKSPYGFSPVLISNSQAALDQISSYLLQSGYLTGRPAGLDIMGKRVMDLTDYLKWN